jgi:2,3-bisphosphoglycerate-dependent phosphoglycerate mutase
MPNLVLLRHGESVWNLQNRFTGWVDVSLSERGIAEAVAAGKQLCDFDFDVVFSSALLRAQDTAYEVLKQSRQGHGHNQPYLRIHESGSDWYRHYQATNQDKHERVVYISEALNERYYGDLQGLNKEAASERFGAEQVHQWRRGYNISPPGGESLAMTSRRVMRYYHSHIEPRLMRGEEILISAHGNSLRALMMHLEQLTPEQIMADEIKTGTPHVYAFDAQGELASKQVLVPDADSKNPGILSLQGDDPHDS